MILFPSAGKYYGSLAASTFLGDRQQQHEEKETSEVSVLKWGNQKITPNDTMDSRGSKLSQLPKEHPPDVWGVNAAVS